MGRAQGGRQAGAATTAGRRVGPVEPMNVETYQPYGNHGAAISGEMPDFDGLLIKFPRDMNAHEQEQIRGIVCLRRPRP